MRREELPFEGMIDKGYKAKNMLKLHIVLSLIFVPIILLIISSYLNINQRPRVNGSTEYWGDYSPEEALILLFYVFLSVVVIPYLIILTIYYIFISSYVRNFSFIVSEDNIVIEHGVFTKTKVTIPYIRIQSINVISGFFDRWFKLYTVKIATAGSESAFSASSFIKPRREGQIPGIKQPEIIEKKINAMIKKHSQIPGGLEDKIFKPEELAFDNFISYILSKMREGEKLKTNIKTLRETKNISSAQLAEKVGVPIDTIKYLEEGKYNPSLSLAYKIALTLGCKIEDIFQLSE